MYQMVFEPKNEIESIFDIWKYLRLASYSTPRSSLKQGMEATLPAGTLGQQDTTSKDTLHMSL